MIQKNKNTKAVFLNYFTTVEVIATTVTGFQPRKIGRASFPHNKLPQHACQDGTQIIQTNK